MKSIFLFFLMGIALLSTTTALAADRFTVLPQADTAAAQTGRADTVSATATPSFFQISKPQLLPDSLVHFNTPSFFDGLFPKTKREYTRRGILTTAILANWASFYLKRQADTYYGKYRRAARLKNIKTYYNRTAEFDRYSTAMLVVSGAALSVYLYYLFNE